jgi:tetratricopeptide (TPR) repeat protein
MSAVVAQAAHGRHPWLAALLAAPEAELRALVGGYADVPPYGRAEPVDAAASLLFGLPEEDPARRAFDRGCLLLLESLRAAILDADADLYERHLGTLDRLLAVIRRTRPRETSRDLHGRYAYWFRLVETAIVDRGLDLRREFWRVLALTQDVRSETAAPRRFMTLWFELCAEAGPLGRYDETYLDVGLIGLRRLPLGTDDDSNEEAVCHGIARWAARQLPDRQAFLSRWREIASAYPRTPTYWPPLVGDVIVATEDYLAQQADRGAVSFPAAAWWRNELELPVVRPGQRPHPSGRKRPIEPPPREMLEEVLRDTSSPIAALRPRVERLLDAHRRYADATGDTYYLLRTACNVGMRLLREKPAERATRGAVAATLAREALDYAPSNAFAWGLWPNALAAQGALDTAEEVGWEAVRRYPEDPLRRTQLATLIDQQLERTTEAELLLRETVTLFPLNPAARPQLATLLADRLDRPADAVALLREAIEILPDHPYSYAQLATVLADRFGDVAGATKVLGQLQRQAPNNRALQTMLPKLRAGRPLGSSSKVPPRRAVVSTSVDAGIDLAPARARRALFRVETAADQDHVAALDEVRRLLAEDPALAYMRYVAQRTGATKPGARPDTAFAFAFDQAARAGSTPAFEALMKHAFGMDVYLARAGLALVSNATTFAVPPAANNLESGALSRRFAVLTEDMSAALVRPNADRTAFLRLLSDFAAAELSSGLVA